MKLIRWLVFSRLLHWRLDLTLVALDFNSWLNRVAEGSARLQFALFADGCWSLQHLMDAENRWLMEKYHGELWKCSGGKFFSNLKRF